MTDNLVRRMLDSAGAMDGGAEERLLREAADEIERLRDSYWARMEATGRRPRIADYEGEIRRLREGIRQHQRQQGGCGGHYDSELWALLGDDE